MNKKEEIKVIFLDGYKDDNIYSKKELYYLEILREGMKLQSFEFGFDNWFNIKLSITYYKYSFFDRKIEDYYKKYSLQPEKLKKKIYDSYKKIIKYKDDLDEKILMKYLYINVINKKDYDLFYDLLKKVKENISEIISVSDIESI